MSRQTMILKSTFIRTGFLLAITMGGLPDGLAITCPQDELAKNANGEIAIPIDLVAYLTVEDEQDEQDQDKPIRTAYNITDSKQADIKPLSSGENSALNPGSSPPVSLLPPAAGTRTVPTLIDPISEPDIVPLTLDTLNARRAAVDERTDLDEETKAQIAKHFARAQELLNQASEAEKRCVSWKTERDNAPSLIAELKSQLDQPSNINIELNPDHSSSEIDQLRLADEENLAEARKNLDKWETRAKQRAERRPQMPGLIEATRKQLEEAENALKVPSPEGETAAIGIARRTEHEAFVVLLKAQLELYRTEQQRYESLNEMFPLQRDLLARNCNTLAKRVELWKDALAKARLLESERQRQEAREKLKNTHPALRNLAERNSWLTHQRKEQQQLNKAAKAQLLEIDETFRNVDQRFRNVAEKEKRIGLTTALGLMLRNHRANLPDDKPIRKYLRSADLEMVQLQTEQMQLEDDRKELADLEFRLEFILSAIPKEEVAIDDLPKMARELLTDQRKYMDDLLADYDQNLATHSEIGSSANRLIERIGEYERFLDERVLWIASAPMIDANLPMNSLQAASALLTHGAWAEGLEFCVQDIRGHLPLYMAVLIAISILIFLRLPAAKVIAQLHEATRQDLYSGVPQAILATLLTITVTSAWPALLLFWGWRVSQAETGFAVAFGDALRFGAIHFWVLNAVRGICERDGVAQRFLNWPKRVAVRLHWTLMMYIMLGVPLGILISFTSNFDEFGASATIGRIGLIGYCILLAFVTRRIVRNDGVIAVFLRTDAVHTNSALRWLWYSAAVILPSCLAVLAMLGYQYTAEQLLIRFEMTLGLAFGLFIGFSMFTRWMMAARRKLALKHAQSRLDAVASQQSSTSESLPAIEPQQVDLSLLNRQALKVLRASTLILFLCGCWAIWSQVLPALQVFSRVELWSVAVETSELVETLNDGPVVRDITRVESVTLGYLLLAIGVMVVAVIASRNLPGLMEFSFLQRLPLDQGGRMAISKLSGYALVVAAVIVSSNIIGLRWSSIQWLVAALTVGLGFGLQEIFANFVSGLIILFERPVRVGDVVTIDNVTGTVSRIQIRATTITDFDFKEFIVPNKEFVTGRLMNWTLSDRRHRVIISLNVAYDADIEQALHILERVSLDHPGILTDPAPVVTFESFNESTIQLMLRAYLPNVDHRWLVRTQLNLEIAKRFKSAGIRFAYPQRELHIRSLPELSNSSEPTSNFGLESSLSPTQSTAKGNTNQAA